MLYFFFYFPLGTEDRPRRFPWLTASLVVALTAVHILLHYIPVTSSQMGRWVLSTADPRLASALTACFVHGGLFHLVGNLLYLATFGPSLEDRLGVFRTLLLYILAGVFSMGAQVVMIRWLQPEAAPVAVLGASGAISGLLGLFLVRCWFLRVRVGHATMALLQGYSKAGVTPVPAWAAVAMWTVLQVIHSLLSLDGQGGTAYWAHLGGLVFGVVAGLGIRVQSDALEEQHLVRARRHLASGNAFGALGAFQAYRGRAGETLEGLLGEGRCLRLLQRPAEAESYYETAFAMALEDHDHDVAYSIVEETGRMTPAGHLPSLSLRRLGSVLERDGRILEAVECYERSGLVNPRPESAVDVLLKAAELVRLRVGDLDRAAAIYEYAAARLEQTEGSGSERVQGLRDMGRSCHDMLLKRFRHDLQTA